MAYVQDTGRPLKFQSVEDLQKKIDAYFRACDPHWVVETYWYYPTYETLSTRGKVVEMPDYRKDPIKGKRKVLSEQQPYTITGLALALDTTRRTLLDYELGNYDPVRGDDETEEQFASRTDMFSHTVQKAKLRIHNYGERRLDGNNPTGTIFSLKNNFGWVDKTEQDVTSKGEKVGTVDASVAGAFATFLKSQTQD